MIGETDQRLSSSLECICALPQPDDWSQLHKDLDPEWIESALNATGTATLRTRRLPADQVVWLLIGMALLLGTI